MTSTPDTPDRTTPDPELLHNEPLEELRGQDVDKLITPDEIVFQGISDPEPTDAPDDALGEDAD